MSGAVASGLFAPAMALSVRLGPWGRALLIGALLCALAAPGGLLAWQWYGQWKALGTERQGVKALVAQEQVFAMLAAPRGAGADGAAAAPTPETAAAIEALLRRARADGLALHAERLERAWSALGAVAVEDAPRQAAAQAAVLDALRQLMRESARTHGLFLDARLDAAADLLATQLPQLLQALGRPQDTPAEAAEPRLLLASLQPALQAGLAQLGAQGAAAPRQQLEQLQQTLARPAEDAAAAAPTESVVPQARALFDATATAADGLLGARQAQQHERLVLLAAALAGTWVVTAYLLAGFQLRTRREQPPVPAIADEPAMPGPAPESAAAASAQAAPSPASEAAPPDAPAKLTLHPPPMDSDALQRARVLQQALQPRDAAAEAHAPLPSPVQDLPAAVLPGKRLLLDLRLFLRDDEVLRVSKAVGKALAPHQPDLAADARLCVEALLAHLIRQQLPGMPEASAQLLLSLGEAGLEVMLRDDALPADLLLDPLDRGLDVVRATMDEVLSFHDGRGNLIVLSKAVAALQVAGQGV